MKKLIIALVVALASIACDAPHGITKTPNANPQLKVEVLTHFDGITLYQVSGEVFSTVYVAKLDDTKEVSTHWSASCGDDCTQMVQVQTLAHK